MSYTKFSKAVTKWLKANGLPCYGTAYDSPEETKARLDAWDAREQRDTAPVDHR